MMILYEIIFIVILNVVADMGILIFEHFQERFIVECDLTAELREDFM